MSLVKAQKFCNGAGLVRSSPKYRAALQRALSVLFLSCIAVVAAPPGSRSQEICGPALAACDLQADAACLERTYACGEYLTVIQTLFVEDFAPTADQKYFLGASFFGMHVRERSAGLQCEMVQFSREYLADYLSTLDQQFTETGSFGTVRQMDQLYHATRMIDELGAISGCPESALTRARIAAIATNEAVGYSKSVFLSPPNEARDLLDTLVIALRSFVSRASDLETGIALRRVEIASARSHLDAISEIFADVFGTVTRTGGALLISTDVLDDLDLRTKRMLRDVEIEEGRFTAALGGISAEDYARIRGETIANAETYLKHSAFHINMIGILLPTDPTSPFWQLSDDVGAETAGKQAFDDLAQIREDWADFGAASALCGQPGAADRVWYCR